MDDMSVKQVLRMALEDAVSWQSGLLDAHKHMMDDPYVAEIQATLKAYRKIYKRRYPPRRDPLAGAKLVDAMSLRKPTPNT